MPRKAIIDAPGALHHVIVRGIERRKIFRSFRIDTANAYGLFCKVANPRHFHLLLRTGPVPIAALMNRLLTGYAGWFNKKYKRHGQLFQNRYKSFLCQKAWDDNCWDIEQVGHVPISAESFIKKRRGHGKRTQG